MYHLPVVFIGAIATFLFHLACKPAFVDNNQTVKRVFNELIDNEETRGRPRKWKELNMTEFLGIYGMNVILCCVFAEYMAIICIEFNMSHLIINISLFKQFRSNVFFIAFACICEAYSSAMFLINTGFFLALNFLLLSKVEADTDDIRTNLRRNMRNVGNLVCKLRKSQLCIQFFNIFNAWFLHVFKTGVIMGAIIQGYIWLRYQSLPLVAIFCIYCHFSSFAALCYTFQRGYSVKVRQQNAKRAILAASRRIRDGGMRDEVHKDLRSVKCVGSKVGEFQEIERNSPIIFIDYVETQVIGLLLAC